MTTKQLIFRAIAAACVYCCLSSCSNSPVDVTFVVTGNDQMRFSQERFETTAPATVTIKFKNVGTMPKQSMGHNFVLLKKGAKTLEFAGRCLSGGATMENDFLPEAVRNDVLAHTKLLGPGEDAELTVKLDEAGSYPYLCTFVGHASLMRGVIIVK